MQKGTEHFLAIGSTTYRLLGQESHTCLATWNERVMVIPSPSLRSTLAFSPTEVTFGAEGKREEYDTT